MDRDYIHMAWEWLHMTVSDENMLSRYWCAQRKGCHSADCLSAQRWAPLYSFSQRRRDIWQSKMKQISRVRSVTTMRGVIAAMGTVVTFGPLHNDSELEQHLTDRWRLHTSDPVYQISAPRSVPLWHTVTWLYGSMPNWLHWRSLTADWHMLPENDSFSSSQHHCLLWRGTWVHY